MKILKNKNFKILLIGIIIILIFFLCAIDSKGQEQIFDPISYDFNTDVLYDKDGSFEPNMYNVRQQSEYKGHYESIYSFRNDINEQNPNNFIVSEATDTHAHVIDNMDNHSKVLELYDNNDAGIAEIRQDFDEILSTGVISFWWMCLDNFTSSYKLMYFQAFDNNDIEIIRIAFNFQLGSRISNNDGTGYSVIASNIRMYQWYNIMIDFNCILDSFDFYVQNEFTNSGGFYNEANGISYIIIKSQYDSEGNKPTFHYIDALDYSWNSGYYLNRNLIPQKESTDILEVDKYEFDYNSISFETDLYSWKQNEYNETTNDVQIKVSGTQSINKWVSINAPAYTDSYKNGIQFNDNSNGYIINVSLSIEIYFVDVWCAHFIYIFSQNINLNYPIAMKFNGATNSIDVYNISSLSFESFSTFTDQIIYEVNFYLNYYDDIMIITLNSTEGFVKGFYPLDDNDNKWNNLYGLDYIQVNNSMSSEGDFALINLYNVGIYENGKYFQSILDNREFGLFIYEIDDVWNSINHNLITLNSENDYKLYVFTDCAKFDCGILLRSRNIQSEREIINIQDYGKLVFNYSIAYLVFMLFDNFSIPYEVEIEGISLIDNNGVSSHATYIYDNTYPNRYFFYCIDNKLYYNFSNSYKLGIETMTIVFDIKDILLDKSFLFAYKSYITDEYNGLITLESYGFYESFNIPNDIKPINSVYNVSLQQEFTLTEIRIHIKTDIDDFASGYTSGFIQNLNLYYDVPLEPDYDPISVLELDFLEAMIFIVIRLIFFLIPSLIFRTKFGNKSILPMWLLIGLILFISGLIPFWLFFIQIIAIGSMLMLNRSKEVD